MLIGAVMQKGEPMDDCISRKAAIDICNDELLHTEDYSPIRTWNRILELPSAQPEPQWIPCSERLPDHGGYYIVTRIITEEDDKWVGTKWYSTGHGWEWDENPIAWMPLPEPYKENSDG